MNNPSHTYIIFQQGPAYIHLGWKAYREFNGKILACLEKIRKEKRKTVYLHEHEVLNVERMFVWCFSLFEADEFSRDELISTLWSEIQGILSEHPATADLELRAHHDDALMEVFVFDPEYFYRMEKDVGKKLEATHPPREKTYAKEDFDLKELGDGMTVESFRKLVSDYLTVDSVDDIMYRSALDGFHSAKRRPNKSLKEELIPIRDFLLTREVPLGAIIRFGLDQGRYDAMIEDKEAGSITVIEVTRAAPNDDHEMLSLLNQDLYGQLPAINRARIKKGIDSIPNKIMAALVEKQAKDYEDDRILIITTPPEYVYQGEAYIIEEMIAEVRQLSPQGKGRFREVLLYCKRRFYSLF
ncbi:MAG: hypothetical protein WBW32_07860 [Luteibacter sp.]